MKEESYLRRHSWTGARQTFLALAWFGLPIIALADDVEYAATSANQLATIDFQTGVLPRIG